MVAAAAVLLAFAQSSADGSIGFGVKNREVSARLANAFVEGHLPVYPSARAYHAASASAQVAFVKAFLTAVKAGTQTEAFRADYAKRREGAKPQPSKDNGSASDQVSAQQAQQRKQIEDTKKQIASMPANMQPQMLEMVKKMEADMAKHDADPRYQSMLKQGAELQGQEDQKRYQRDLADWNTRFPEDPNTLIVQRLKGFLALTADVDFNAQLTRNSKGVSRFADARFESKSDDWKLCFRAGREPVAAARSFVTEWLRQLGK
jgi:uncharacterized protein GlcG (DUF336 family)